MLLLETYTQNGSRVTITANSRTCGSGAMVNIWQGHDLLNGSRSAELITSLVMNRETVAELVAFLS